MEHYYSSDRNVQMLVYLLKENGIKKIIVSPGTTHIGFIASVQHDPFFEVYSAFDERNAAYMACGMAFESGEPVVITCTGATASRNYYPGLSEAFYRKLPILAVTGAHDYSNSGNLLPQFIDRSVQPKDLVKLSVRLQKIKDKQDEIDCNLKINRALLELRRNGGGPVHIDLVSNLTELDVKELPATRVIRRYTVNSKFPEITSSARIAISVGAHKPWSAELTKKVDAFCAQYNAVVFVDHSSNYHGNYKVLPTLAATQEHYSFDMLNVDLLIHIGEQSGDYYTWGVLHRAKEVWRVSDDGEIRDTFGNLSNVFDMSEENFFNYYVTEFNAPNDEYLTECKEQISEIYNRIPELPFSNIWLAKTIAPKLPENSVVHLGVSNTMRSWTFFELHDSIISTANLGCRGIDGAISSALGMSLVNQDKLHFLFLGDLTFFYNINELGNRHLGNNLRILLVNNGKGTEFCMYSHPGKRLLGDDVIDFVAADGHFGQESPLVVKHLAEDLGFEYLTADSKQGVESVLDSFLASSNKPIIFEVFTDSESEDDALKLIRNIYVNKTNNAKATIKNILGEKGTNAIKKIIKI